MSRPLRIEYPGALHHCISRGDNRRKIVWDDADRRHPAWGGGDGQRLGGERAAVGPAAGGVAARVIGAAERFVD